MKSIRFYTLSITLLAIVVFVGIFMPFSGSIEDGERRISDGIRYYQQNIDGPFQVSIIEVDLNNRQNRLVSWRSGGLVTTTQQVRDARNSQKNVVGAINADFFSFQSTLPVGNQVSDGVWVHGINSRRSHVVIDVDNQVSFRQVSFSGRVSGRDGRKAALTGVNRHRANDQAMFYNAYYGNHNSRSDSSGVELVLRLVEDQAWLAGNTVSMVVEESVRGAAVVRDGLQIISVGRQHPDYAFFSKKQTSDTLQVSLGFGDESLMDIAQVIGGGGLILRDGANVSNENTENERISESFMTTRHPRTVVATNESGDKAWLIAIDGRQAASAGMNFDEMADYLIKLGAWHAINLDGGGSTTMAVGEDIVNSPSDPTGERAVANILLIEVGD